MWIEGPVKFFSPQNTAGVSQEKGVAVFSQTVKVNGDQDSNSACARGGKCNVTQNMIRLYLAHNNKNIMV